MILYWNRFNYESMNGQIEKGISNAFNKLKVTRDDRKIDDVIIKYCLYLSLRARTVFNFF